MNADASGQNSIAGGDWHPAVRLLHDYWDGLRAGRRGLLPSRRDIDPLALPPALLPFLWIVDWQPSPPRLRYRLLGTKIVQFYGRDYTGKWVDEAHGSVPELETILEGHRRAAASGVPDWRRGKPHLNYEKVSTLERIALPLAADGRDVDGFLMQTRFYRADGREIV
jgi:hypothetical protein